MSNEAQLPSIDEVAKQVAAEKVARENKEAGVIHETEAPVAVDTEEVETVEEVVETPVEVAEPVKKDPLGPKFAALAQKEKAARAAEAKAKQMQAEAEAKMREVEARIKAIEERDSNKPKRPMDALKRFGFNYQDATEEILGGYKEPEPDPLEERFKPLNEKLTEVDQLKQQLTQLQERLQEKENLENYNKVMGNIQSVIKDGGDQYELVSLHGQEGLDLVRETLVQYYREYGEYLDYEAAAARVEDYYEKRLAQLEASKKLRSKFAPAATETKPTKAASKPLESANKSEKVTLTSDMTGGSNATVDIDKLPRDEAIRYLSRGIKRIDD